MPAIITKNNISTVYYFLNFLKSKTVQEVLFALIQVNKVVFGSNPLKMSVSFDKNF